VTIDDPLQNAAATRRMAATKAEDVSTAADAASPGGARLLAFWNGGFAGYPLPSRGRAVIGRLEECAVRIDHPSVSRRHAEIVMDPAPHIVDLGSFNGTRVGGARIAPHAPTPVHVGAVIEIGSTYVVLERTTDARAVPPPAPAPAHMPIVLDERMKHLHRLLAAVALGTISVLLLGETGTGKEIVARSIHRYSPRAAGPFVSINCAAIPEALLESELFGHERGAFTGAVKERVGLLEAAAGGTLFLDEIGEMPLSAQAKLLRAIELRQVVRVGGVRPRAVDVRFVSATNRDLESLIVARTFREDLFFRLNGVLVTIPPLRERLAEIDALALRFLAEHGARLGRPGLTLTAGALAALRAHAWPGNVRELRNVVERAALLCTTDAIGPEHLALPSTPQPAATVIANDGPADGDGEATAGLLAEVGALERRRIVEALAACAGNQTRAAAMLGMSRRMLIHRLETYGFPRPRK
jgi:DNA-binding NtrC family response regulator